MRWAVAEGRWQRPHPRVVVTHNGPLDLSDQLRVAVAIGPIGTLLAGPTAAAQWGLRGFERRDEIHLLIPHPARSFRQFGVVVHRSIALEDEPGVGDPPRTSVERSIVDSASWSFTAGQARVIVLAAVQQRLSTTERLRAAVANTGPIPRIQVIRESLLDAEGGIHSVPERQFALLLREHGLPEPVRQAPVRGPSGRYYLDADFTPWGISVEVDGAQHHDVRQHDADVRRQNEVVLGGRTVLRFTSYQVRHEPAQVARVLRRALVTAGW